MSRVLIEPASYSGCRAAVDRSLELFAPPLSGRRVLIKPNVLRSSGPEEGVVTHPALVRAVVDAVEDAGAGAITVGDNPGLFDYGDNERCFRETGLMEAARGYYANIGHESEEMAFDPSLMPRVSLSSEVLRADVVISLPKFKTHGLTVITGAIKNSYGILPGGQKARLHRETGEPLRFHEAVVDVFRLRVPDVFIMDAVVGMEGNGPASPELRDVGRILASDNAVAMDAVVARMMGLDPGKLRFLQRARELGLGEFDLEAIDILGDMETIPDYKIPPLGGEANLQNETLQEVIHNRARLTARADPELCTGCGVCVDHCPVSALTLNEKGIPVVEADTCITCFCCQEICPEKAMALA